MVLEFCLYLIKTPSLEIKNKDQSFILLPFEENVVAHWESACCDVTEGTDASEETLCLVVVHCYV